MLGTMTPEPSDPTVVSVQVPLVGYALPPISGIILAVLVIVAIVLVARRLRSSRHPGELADESTPDEGQR